MRKEELKPCPFCGGATIFSGGEVTTTDIYENGEKRRYPIPDMEYRVGCGKCGATITITHPPNVCTAKKDAERKWNQRTPTAR